jgi:hypothetical protein
MLPIASKEIESVIRLDAFQRYLYFMKRVADNAMIYYLVDESGNLGVFSFEDKTIFSIWSAKEYADLNKTEKWTAYLTREVNINEFYSNIIPIVKSSNYLLSVFAVNNKAGFIVDSEEFVRDLDGYLADYE